MNARSAERRITAFLDGPDSLEITNIIHSTAGAAAYGYRGALVGGVTVYGWAVPAILDVLGESWLDRGWADVSFRRPVYPGDAMNARAELDADGSCSFAITNGSGERCVEGVAAAGDAPWRGELRLPSRRQAEARPLELPSLTPATVPVGTDLRPMAVPISREDARQYALEKQLDDDARWSDRIHPAWLAARMSPLMHHSFDYGPSIHARSQAQHLAPALAGQIVTVAGRVVEAFERKGHQYAVIDGRILDEDRRELAAIRHTTIYQVARRE